TVSDTQITRAIRKLNPFKAPGKNGICNSVLINCADILIPYLGPLYCATFNLNIYPASWRDSITVIIRKPGKLTYSDPGVFRPIALLDTIGKVLSSCIAESIVHKSEERAILPPNHFG
ncbi:hypothetical protein K439DRAFT_1290926, partial [Ramaria rubella]